MGGRSCPWLPGEIVQSKLNIQADPTQKEVLKGAFLETAVQIVGQ